MNLTIDIFKRFYYKLFFSRKFFYSTFASFLAILIGFFSANNISTILGQTGDWGILSSGILVALVESINKIVYNHKKKLKVKSKTQTYFILGFQNF
jgi:ABC-type nitrate/sulfonate/bicarbonate transport system permease component